MHSINYYTYGYLAGNNRHLTSFAVGLRRRSFVQNVCDGIKNLHTTSPESAVRNEYKYQLNPQKWRARFSGKIWMKFELKWRRNGEKMRNKIWRGRRNLKSKWRRRLLQFRRCNKSRSSEVGHEQYWIFITHVSIL